MFSIRICVFTLAAAMLCGGCAPRSQPAPAEKPEEADTEEMLAELGGKSSENTEGEADGEEGDNGEVEEPEQPQWTELVETDAESVEIPLEYEDGITLLHGFPEARSLTFTTELPDGLSNLPPPSPMERTYGSLTLKAGGEEKTFWMVFDVEPRAATNLYVDLDGDGDFADNAQPIRPTDDDWYTCEFTPQLGTSADNGEAYPYVIRFYTTPAAWKSKKALYYARCFWQAKVNMKGNERNIVLVDSNSNGDYSDEAMVIDADGDRNPQADERLKTDDLVRFAETVYRVASIAPTGDRVLFERRELPEDFGELANVKRPAVKLRKNVLRSPGGTIEITLAEGMRTLPPRDVIFRARDFINDIYLVVWKQPAGVIPRGTTEEEFHNLLMRDILRRKRLKISNRAELTINGIPAVQNELRGKQYGILYIHLCTTLKGDGGYYFIETFTRDAWYKKHRETMHQITRSFREIN